MGEALRDRSFVWIVVAFWLSALATIAVGFHLVPYLVDRGYGWEAAAVATDWSARCRSWRGDPPRSGNAASPRILSPWWGWP